MLQRVLAAILLALALVDTSPTVEDCDLLELPKSSKLATALEGVSGALHCFHEAFLESLKDNRESNRNLTKLVLELKDEVRNSRNGDCDISEVKKLAEEKGELKTQLQECGKKVNELERKLEVSVKQVEELKGKLQLHNNTVAPHNTRNPEACEHWQQPGIKEQVEEFSWSRDLGVLTMGLMSVLGNDSTAYKQLQHLDSTAIGHPLWTIGKEGYTTLAILLVCGGLPAEAKDPDRDGMLHGAASTGQIRMMMELLDLGADINAPGSSSRTPLITAASYNHVDMVRLLVERGAAVNASMSDGDTALHVATTEGNLVVVRYLTAAGADTKAVGKDGYTALDIAQNRNNAAIINHLSQFPH